MKKDDIKKASEQYANDVCRGSLHRSGLEQYCMVDFMEGAKWRINSVWHEELEKSKTRKCIMVRFTNGLFNLFEDVRELKGIEDRVESFAYIEDLLPTKED
ncbi:hypothetical protein H6B28_12190 [Bacteroides mediterraneensis]|nr:hypothetical protein [Bacteroides mediterraneensis]